MRALTFLVAGQLDARTGGSIYNRRMIEGLAHRGWTVDVNELDDSFPFPTADALRRASAALAQIPAGRLVVIDGLAFGTMPDLLVNVSQRLNIVALLHLPLAATIGLNTDVAARFARSEQMALMHARRVIVTGAHTLALMRQYGLTHNNVAVVEPGTDPAPLATGSGSAEVQLLTVATLNPGKGHIILIEALATLPHRRWRLACAANVERYPETAAAVRATISRLGLDEHISLVGELCAADLERYYDRSDIVVLASALETYGMVVAEALARGLPVIATATGAIPTLLGDDAGVVVPRMDAGTLAAALRCMIDDATLRARCAAGARRVRERLPNWDAAADRMSSALSD